MKYKAEIKLAPGNKNNETFDVTVNKKIEETLYDDVVDAIYDNIDKVAPEEYYPKAEIDKIYIYDEGTLYPVVGDSDNKAINKLSKDKKFTKFLVLPEARYSLTPECKLWMDMKQNGIISEDSPFEADKYHNILVSMGYDFSKDGIDADDTVGKKTTVKSKGKAKSKKAVKGGKGKSVKKAKGKSGN